MLYIRSQGERMFEYRACDKTISTTKSLIISTLFQLTALVQDRLSPVFIIYTFMVSLHSSDHDMSQSHHKLEVFSWVAGIAGTILTFYIFLSSSPNSLTQAKTIAPIVSPSFDCLRASNRVERLICNTQDLSILDLSMATAYRDLSVELTTKNQRSELKKSQNYWLRNVRDQCLDVACLKGMYEERITQLRDARH
jgi:uncharacterized protein YecT (DUF1311 family)